MIEERIADRQQENEDLVYIDVVLIDRKSSEYVSKYNKVELSMLTNKQGSLLYIKHANIFVAKISLQI